MSGTHLVNDFNSMSSGVADLNSRCEKVIGEFKVLKEKILKVMK